MKLLLAILFLVLCISPIISQQDLQLVYNKEINYHGEIAYYAGSLFSGILVDEKTNKELGKFQRGKKHGTFKEYYSNQKIAKEVNYLNGIKEGQFTIWFDNGRKHIQGQYSSDQYTGEFKEWYENGNIKIIANFINGIPNASNKEYYPNGKIQGEAIFSYDPNRGITTEFQTYWYENGNKKSEWTFVNNIKEGEEIYYHSNSKLNVKYNYSNGNIIVGTYPMYNEDGVCIKKEIYDYKICEVCNGDHKQKCSVCSGKGKFNCVYCTKGQVNCENCEGNGNIKCDKCSGQGKWSRCKRCNGYGQVKNEPVLGGFLTYTGVCTDCMGKGSGNFSCSTCKASGKVACIYCSGQKTIDCNHCNGGGYKICINCSGFGKTSLNCLKCSGTGKSTEVMVTMGQLQSTDTLFESSTNTKVHTVANLFTDTTYSNGNRYLGYMKYGKKNGQGKMHYNEERGFIYNGEWKDDNRDGFGTITWDDGSLNYQGNFKNNVPDGQGITYDKGKKIYDGEWKNGKRNGKGKYNYYTKTTKLYQEGFFVNGTLNGQGIRIFESNDGILVNYKGNFINGNLEGLGSESTHFGDGASATFSGEYKKDNKFNGIYYLTISTGKKFEIEYKNGVEGKRKKVK